MTTPISITDRETVHHLWDQLADFDLSQPGAAVTWLMEALAAMDGICNVSWAGAIRMDSASENDPLRGWRVAVTNVLRPLVHHSDEGHLAGVMDVWDRREIDPSFLLPLREVGTFRNYSLRRNLPPEWFQTAFYRKHYAAFGIHDLVLVGFPLNEDCESHFGLYSTQPISDEVIETFTYAMRGIKWFHHQLLLTHGLFLASSPLTPTEQRVLHLLLTELPEKQIGSELGIGEAATHAHVKSTFRKFGVRSRAGLISLWLSGPGAPPTD